MDEIDFFELLFSGYSKPLELLDIAIKQGKLCKMTEKVIENANIKTAWELWLHRKTGKSWEEMMLSAVPQKLETDKEEIESIERKLMKGGVFE